MLNNYKTNNYYPTESAGRSSLISTFEAISLNLWFPYVRLLIWSLGLDRKSFTRFAIRIRSLWIHNGLSFTVLYLKECVRIMQHFVSGNPVFVTTEMPISITNGIPTIIPGSLRLLIKQKNPVVIRGVLSLLSVYRVMKIPTKLKLETITSPFTGRSPILPLYELSIVKQFLPPMDGLKPIKLELLRSAGPNCKVSMLGIWLDIKAWSEHRLFPQLLDFISLTPDYFPFMTVLLEEYQYLEELKTTKEQLFLGRLAVKEEPAGKARVFAITDSITQSVMRPLADSICSLLKRLPMDGTFNQSAPLDRLMQLKKDGLIPLEERFYSYDLSAATDRLPIDLQEQILSLYFGSRFSNLWKNLLSDRDWYFPKTKENIRYAVGQPMGALSSWTMLALTHHFIVRLAANRIGISKFNHYALLGDDIVIANEAVAKSYHHIMVEILGVSINLSKSLVSTHSFEFAKRLVTIDGELTPAGPANLLLALKSLNGIPSLLLDLVQKGYQITEETLDDLLKSVPTVRKSHIDKIKWVIKGPFGFIPTKEGLSSLMTMGNSLLPVRAEPVITAVRYVKHLWDLDMWTKVVKDNINYRISISELMVPIGFSSYEDNFDDSPVKREIISRLSSDLQELGRSRPVFKVIEGGVVGLSAVYGELYSPNSVEFITNIVRGDPSFRIGGSDPFVVIERPSYAFSEKFKGIKFFEQVLNVMKYPPQILQSSSTLNKLTLLGSALSTLELPSFKTEIDRRLWMWNFGVGQRRRRLSTYTSKW